MNTETIHPIRNFFNILGSGIYLLVSIMCVIGVLQMNFTAKSTSGEGVFMLVMAVMSSLSGYIAYSFWSRRFIASSAATSALLNAISSAGFLFCIAYVLINCNF